MDKENLGDSGSPHFMTPTVSSSKQSTTMNIENNRPSSTLPLKPSKAEGGNAWVRSAAKRVGFRRNDNDTPRLKKEALSKPAGNTGFPSRVWKVPNIRLTFAIANADETIS